MSIVNALNAATAFFHTASVITQICNWLFKLWYFIIGNGCWVV